MASCEISNLKFKSEIFNFAYGVTYVTAPGWDLATQKSLFSHLEDPLDILGDYIHFKIYFVARFEL